MITKVLRITLVVRDQQEALRYYVDKLGFVRRMDNPLGAMGRWVTVAAPDDANLEIVLQPPDWFQGDARRDREALVGKNPTLVVRVDDCLATVDELRSRGVSVRTVPEATPWGLQAIVRDMDGNELVLLQP
jgi:catechol 2,3-dioxygenase-like lactoylglutathione lyase family enzyme